MLYTLKTKLHPTAEQSAALLNTMEHFNAACDYISKTAFDGRTFGKIKLQQECYYNVRKQFGLSAQMVVRAIGKVAESYKLNRDKLHRFKPHGAIVYDQRILTIKTLDLISILTLAGRMEVPMTVCDYYRRIVDNHRVRGQADLAYSDGVFYLLIVVDAPDKPRRVVNGYLGVDLGIVNIATTSDGKSYSGKGVRNIRHRNLKLRQRLQSIGTKSAKRLLKKRRRKETRFATDVNHVISKQLVNAAQGTGRALALEDLQGIRARAGKPKRGKPATVGKTMRQELSSWSFYQLRQFIAYKAQAAGVSVVFVDPRNTSRECPVCGNIDKANRPSQSKFLCTACGHSANADINAAVNISRRAAVIQPYAVGA